MFVKRIGLGVVLGCTLGSVGCSAELSGQRLPGEPRCQPEGEHRQYLLKELLIPAPESILEDLDGDGLRENIAGYFLFSSRETAGIPGLPGFDPLHIVNSSLASGRGGLVIDVQAGAHTDGCVGVTIRNVEAVDEGPKRQMVLGSQSLTLRGWGTHKQLQTIRTARLRDEDTAPADFYLPTLTTGHHARLHGAQMELRQVSDSTIEVRAFGVLPLRNLAETTWPVWAKEMTAVLNAIPKAELIPKGTWQRIASIEDRGRNILIPKPPEDSCFLDGINDCVLLPEELARYYEGQYAPDLQMFDESGRFRPHPGAAAQNRDSFSFGMAFRAELTEPVPARPSGRFYEQPVPLEADEVLLAGWAGRSSDLWLLTGRCRALHHDGFSWKPYELPGCTAPAQEFWSGAIFGTRNDAVWAAVAPGKGFYRWDGGRWRSPHPTDSIPGDILAMHGVADNDVWAITSANDQPGADRIIRHYDGNKYSIWGTFGGMSQDLQTILSLGPESTFAGGYGAGLLELGPGSLARIVDTAVLSMNILGLAGNSAQNIWAMTGGTDALQGDCLHFDGTRWSKPTGVGCEADGKGYLSAWMDRRGVLWAGGEKGLLRVYDPARSTGFRDVPHSADPSLRIQKIFGAADDGAVWAMAGDRTLLRYQP